ncbi:NAD(P)-dependent dehydrogenase (short-subunit alcohol dehydrogenase family) [Variovorax boronicumulans]|uniref:oxidoreductase n=1 Tax=Variovorax boronicumulans TaxID=436515 RepID=UPI0027818278|nr:oxidoreductase [Variovorax boronicumulans]MDP9992803.1 NAD(P)-dependent dehydrogenase (short-subunit alcohol dehydrogenase family) [Variovorax boronicumulans]MDQ0004106.1 NAD(P)-dependent dehydrogenase (short-subunit alcohol dehydrogenase family) [Variovorax boronicumulans]
MKNTRTFFITGVSSGFGRAIASAALQAGHRVVGTVRNEQAAAEFQTQFQGDAHVKLLDVTQFDAVAPLAAAVEAELGPVDVVINNAGYGHEGILEESSLDEMRRQFDVNVFGAVAVMKAFLPFMRQRRRGHIVNITSMGGYITMPGISYYCGSKFALEGISETLAKEVKSLGIAVTAVAPGSFRTDWAGRSMVRSACSIGDYDSLFDPIRQSRIDKSGKQLGDPRKAAAAILALVDMQEPPEHLLIGSDALGLVRAKTEAMLASLARHEALTRSTDIV